MKRNTFLAVAIAILTLFGVGLALSPPVAADVGTIEILFASGAAEAVVQFVNQNASYAPAFEPASIDFERMELAAVDLVIDESCARTHGAAAVDLVSGDAVSDYDNEPDAGVPLPPARAVPG